MIGPSVVSSEVYTNREYDNHVLVWIASNNGID